MSLSEKQFYLLVAGLVGVIVILVPLALLMLGDRPGVSQEAAGTLPTLPELVSSPAPLASGQTSSQFEASPQTGPPASEPTGPSSEGGITPLPDVPDLEHAGGNLDVTSQFDLPAGVYRVFIHTDASFTSIRPVVDEGECGEYPFFTDIPGPFEGSATYRSTGCLVRFEAAGISGDWTITVEPVVEDEKLTPPLTLSGDKPMTTDLVDLPAGEYRLELKSDSQYCMVVPIVVEGPCVERPIFLLTEPGQFEETYTSKGCQIVFQVDDVTADWELSISTGE